ncbi:MAG: DUF1295 domain-containing protein [Hyphomicrobiaceae bacterium]|nr:DUF1295 domain-containing protein [Hyphomicrobiaceae bacterium]
MLVLLGSLILLVAAMAGAWLVRQRTHQSGWIDTIWSAATGVACLLAVFAADGAPERKLAAAVLLLVWSVRLATHIGRRTAGGHDDPRYAGLITQWGADAGRQLFLFLEAQALAGFGLAVSVYAASSNAAPFPGILDVLALGVGLVALMGEALADRQLARFRSSAIRGDVCEAGLWRFSRHPNYFFEWLWWCAWPLLALSGGTITFLTPLAFLAPALMYLLLVRVSGIPPLEAHMLQSRGATYAAYQARVNAFFPGPPRA